MTNANPSAVVVDVSLALKWVLNEPDSGFADLLLAEWVDADLQPVAPSWFACEVANTLHQRHLDGKFSVAEAEEAFDSVLGVVVVIGDEPADARRAMQIAREANQKQTYDAQYAALAERLGCELWTADRKFLNATRGILPGVRSLHERRT
ncbi:MAG: type II toxin-antitoxin system VapC family toxin [Dehalococcoidia bacterium]